MYIIIVCNYTHYVQNIQKYAKKKKRFYLIDNKPNRGYTKNQCIWT
jgi:hypothetical protein